MTALQLLNSKLLSNAEYLQLSGVEAFINVGSRAVLLHADASLNKYSTYLNTLLLLVMLSSTKVIVL